MNDDLAAIYQEARSRIDPIFEDQDLMIHSLAVQVRGSGGGVKLAKVEGKPCSLVVDSIIADPNNGRHLIRVEMEGRAKSKARTFIHSDDWGNMQDVDYVVSIAVEQFKQFLISNEVKEIEAS